MEECPNCFHDVNFTKDTCPDCGKNRKEAKNYKKVKNIIPGNDEKTYNWIVKLLSHVAAIFLTLTIPVSFLFKTEKKKNKDFIL